MKIIRGIKWPLVDKDIPLGGKIATLSSVIVLVSIFNVLLRIHLPGITNVDIRPQIVLIAIAGYLMGPVFGFLAGLGSNCISDIFLGYGFHYFATWTIGNGLIGAMMGLSRLRRLPSLDRIGQLTHLTITLIVINIFPFAYATALEVFRSGGLSTSSNFTYFFLPAVLSNIICMLLLFPVILMAAGRIKLNFPIKISLINYYLAIFVVFMSWGIFANSLIAVSGSINYAEVENGNAFVLSFNHWCLLLAITLVLSFAASSWVSKLLVSPIKDLERSVFDVLRGRPESLSTLASFSHREDELGVLSRTISMLSGKLINTQILFRDEMNKRVNCINPDDSGTDIFVVGIISTFGKDAYESVELERLLEKGGVISNLSAIDILVSSAGLRELASTYSESKVEKSLENIIHGLGNIINTQEEGQSLALAVDINLVFKGRLMVIDLSAPLEQDFAYHLLENAQALKQNEKRYIGYLTENDIIGKVQTKWFGSTKLKCTELESVMDSAIRGGIIRGYQIKSVSDLAHFDQKLKITYSHSNFKHVKQLIGLLIGEGVQAKVQLEQKKSSFIYLNEWEKTPDLDLEACESGFAIAHKTEFDIVFEFSTPEQRDRFQSLIEEYAKKEDSQGKKLLYESWYQPLFCSSIEAEGYQMIADLNYVGKEYVVHSYCRNEDCEKIVGYFKAHSLSFSAAKVWVNSAFGRYLEGEYK